MDLKPWGQQNLSRSLLRSLTTAPNGWRLSNKSLNGKLERMTLCMSCGYIMYFAVTRLMWLHHLSLTPCVELTRNTSEGWSFCLVLSVGNKPLIVGGDSDSTCVSFKAIKAKTYLWIFYTRLMVFQTHAHFHILLEP